MVKCKNCDKCMFNKSSGYGKENFCYCDVINALNKKFSNKKDLTDIFSSLNSEDDCPFYKEDDYSQILNKVVLDAKECDFDKLIDINAKAIKEEALKPKMSATEFLCSMLDKQSQLLQNNNDLYGINLNFSFVAKVSNTNQGYPWTEKTLMGLKAGQEYEVESVDIHNYITYVKLKDFPNQSFNSLMFDDAFQSMIKDAIKYFRSNPTAKHYKIFNKLYY